MSRSNKSKSKKPSVLKLGCISWVIMVTVMTVIIGIFDDSPPGSTSSESTYITDNSSDEDYKESLSENESAIETTTKPITTTEPITTTTTVTTTVVYVREYIINHDSYIVHSPTCRTLSDEYPDYYEYVENLDIDWAEANGYRACQVCKPIWHN